MRTKRRDIKPEFETGIREIQQEISNRLNRSFLIL